MTEREYLKNRDGDREPLYDLKTHTWDKTCPCIRAMQQNPECPWHGREAMEERSDDSN